MCAYGKLDVYDGVWMTLPLLFENFPVLLSECSKKFSTNLKQTFIREIWKLCFCFIDKAAVFESDRIVIIT